MQQSYKQRPFERENTTTLSKLRLECSRCSAEFESNEGGQEAVEKLHSEIPELARMIFYHDQDTRQELTAPSCFCRYEKARVRSYGYHLSIATFLHAKNI